MAARRPLRSLAVRDGRRAAPRRGPHAARRPDVGAAARGRRGHAPTSCPAPTACSRARPAPPRPSPSSTRRSRWTWSAADGDARRGGPGARHRVAGPLASILTAERTALNFLCHLSGVATLTRRFVDAAAAGGSARIWDTRKTTPGLRTLEKAAVRAGGAVEPPRQPVRLGDVQGQPPRGARHRRGGGRGQGDLARPARPRRGDRPRRRCAQALEAGADAVLLDNMTPEEAKAAVALVDEWAAAHGGPPAPRVQRRHHPRDRRRLRRHRRRPPVAPARSPTRRPALDIGLDIAASG